MLTLSLLIAVAALLALLSTPGEPDAPPAPLDPDGGGQNPQTPPAGTHGEPPDGDLTPDEQARFDKALKDRLARQQRQYEQKLADERAARQKLEDEAEERRKAALTEEQRKEEARQAAEDRAAQLQAELAAERVARLRSDTIAAKGSDLPARFRDLVTGDTAEAIEASIEEVRAEFQGLREGIGADFGRQALRDAVDLPAEEFLTKYPDEGKALLAKFGRTPTDLGSGGANPPPPPPDPNAPRKSIWEQFGIKT